jgi:hypothetical protein
MTVVALALVAVLGVADAAPLPPAGAIAGAVVGAVAVLVETGRRFGWWLAPARKEAPPSQRELLDTAKFPIAEPPHEPAPGNVVSIQLASIEGRISQQENRLIRLEGHMDAVDYRLDGIDARLNTTGTRLAAMETRFSGMEERFAGVEEDLRDIRTEQARQARRQEDLAERLTDVGHTTTRILDLLQPPTHS